MKIFKTLAIVLLMSVGATAAPKHRVQYDVCAIDPGGKLGVYEVSEKRQDAMAIAKYLEGKTKRHYFVVIEEVTEAGDVK